jgi:hypothetical protein
MLCVANYLLCTGKLYARIWDLALSSLTYLFVVCLTTLSVADSVASNDGMISK